MSVIASMTTLESHATAPANPAFSGRRRVCPLPGQVLHNGRAGRTGRDHHTRVQYGVVAAASRLLCGSAWLSAGPVVTTSLWLAGVRQEASVLGAASRGPR